MIMRNSGDRPLRDSLIAISVASLTAYKRADVDIEDWRMEV
jgi:hypothetical protein